MKEPDATADVERGARSEERGAMRRQSLTIELDDETLHALTELGAPQDVLLQLARCAADGVHRPGGWQREWVAQCFGDRLASTLRADSSGGQAPDAAGELLRAQTNASLRLERERANAGDVGSRDANDQEADEVLRVARRRADEVVRTARDEADPAQRPSATVTRASESARELLEHERSDADALLEDERVARRRQRAGLLSDARGATDHDLLGERAHTDTIVLDQRDANEQLVSATLRAHLLADEADVARTHAEQIERELRAVAQFRELFIGILGHDLRNPLGSIVSAAALLLRRGSLGDQDARTVTRIIRSSNRMTRMITQLLDLTRTRLGGGFPLEPAPTDLGELCQDIVDEVEERLELVVEGDLRGTWDRDRLAEVLSNLAGNALEYAEPGTTLALRAHGDGAHVSVEISNRGQPISPEVLPFIFEPFRQERRRERSASGNLGLGLYIARQIVVAHGGTLEVRSTEGLTTFTMRLPRTIPPPTTG
jgi:signal transduction histidine kinase